MQISYTTINHIARRELEISVNEYMIADLVYNLSNNPKGSVQGWCYASKDKIGELLDLNSRTVFRAIEALIEKGLLEKHEDTKHLRATSFWYDSVIIKDTDKMSQPMTKRHTNTDKMSQGSYDKMSYNKENNNKENNNYNSSNDEKSLAVENNISATGNIIEANKSGEMPVLVKTKDGVITSKEFGDLMNMFKPVNPSIGRLFANKGQRSALERLLEEHGYSKIKMVLERLPEIAGKPYAPSITTPYQLEVKLGQLFIYLQREKNKGGGVVDARNL